MSVYLLHFDRPISDRHTTIHYMGFAEDLDHRLAEHAAGRGARLTQVALERGISWTLVRTWDGGRNLERKLKNQKNAPRKCPVCRSAP
jgi:predicted GIY-YIG superfamily endonuclease